MATIKYSEVDKMMNRIELLEEMGGIESNEKSGKPNKFTVMEHQMLLQKINLQEQISDFLNQIKVNRDKTEHLQSEVVNHAVQIEIVVSKFITVNFLF